MRAVVKVLPTEGHHTNLSNEPNFYVEVEVGCQKCSQVFRNFFDSLLDFPPDFPLPDFLPTFPATFFPGLLQMNPEYFVLVINPSEPSQSTPILGDIASTISRKYCYKVKSKYSCRIFRAFESLFCSPLYFKWILCWSSIFDSLVSQHLVHWCTMSLCYLGAETSQKSKYQEQRSSSGRLTCQHPSWVILHQQFRGSTKVLPLFRGFTGLRLKRPLGAQYMGRAGTFSGEI